MAQVLRSKLHALSSACRPPPALACELSKSPGLRLTSRRWLAEDALLEDQRIPAIDTDGGISSAANEDELFAEVLKCTNPDNRLVSSSARLTSLASANCAALASGLQSKEGKMNQSQSDLPHAEQRAKSVGDDWQQAVNCIRSMTLKNPKGLQINIDNTGGCLKAEQSKSQCELTDLDLSQSAEQSSKEPVCSELPSFIFQEDYSLKSILQDLRTFSIPRQKRKKNRDPLVQEVYDLMEKDMQISKEGSFDGTEGLNSLEGFEDSCQIRNLSGEKDILSSSLKDQEHSFTKASDDKDFHDMSTLAAKNRDQDRLLSQIPRALDSPFKQDASHQAYNNSNGVSKQSYMVCVKNLPPSSNPSTVKASMAIHGEVVGFFKKSIQDRLNVYIQFKTATAMQNALASRKLHVGSRICSIVRTDNLVFTTVVRLTKVANDTEEQYIRTVCEQYGKVDGIKKRAPGVFDVFYDTKELSNIPSILGSLSEVTLNRSTWFAFSAPLIHPSVQKEVMKSPEGQSWHDVQVNQAIFRIEAGLDAITVLFQDLKELNTVAREYSN